MKNHSTAAAKVIPFLFDRREVRTLLIDDQPWFVAADVCQALAIRNNRDAIARLDDDERGVATTDTPSGQQDMGIINESGLYSLILTSRKTEAKRFKKWVTAEVLPAIRKHGRYTDESGTMGSLVGAVIGIDGFHCLAAVLDGKVRHLPVSIRKRAKQHVWSQVHKAFSVVSAEDIPAAKLDAACNFIAAYAIEGEWLPKEEKPAQQLDIHYPIEDWKARNPNQFRQDDPASTDLRVGYSDLLLSEYSPCLDLLEKLTKAGFDVNGAFYELRSYQNLMRRMDIVIRAIGGKISDALGDFERDRRRVQAYPCAKVAA